MRASRLTIAGLVAAGAALLFAAAEIALRLKQGERLLYDADPEIEYLPQPNQAVRDNGVDVRTNAFGMRSPPIDERKPANTFRVLALGDSVVFGYINIGHDDLATTRLAAYTHADGRKVEVLNASSSSWGPGNQLAWLGRFGMMDADAVVLVLSTHDLEDDRTFRPPERDAFPHAQPLLHLPDWFWRKLIPDPAESARISPRAEGDALRSLPLLLQRAATAPAGACLIVHPTTDELKEPAPTPGELALADLGRRHGLPVVFNRDFVQQNPGYIDGIHLSPDGQVGLARAMLACPGLAPLKAP